MLLNRSCFRVFVAGIVSLMSCWPGLLLSANENSNATNDSLFNIYITSNNDSVQVAMLVQIAFNMEANSISNFKNKTVNDYLQLANLKSDDSIKTNNLVFQIDKIGVKFRNNGNYISALKFHNWARDIAGRINNKNQRSIISNNIGVVYRRLDDYQTALTNHLDALQLAEETHNTKSRAIAINSIGNIQMMIGNLDEALEYFKQSLIIEQKLSNLLGIAINLNNIGNVYFEKRDFAKALEYYFLSLDVNKEIDSKKGIAICYNDIGNVYEIENLSNEALKYYLDAFAINHELNNKHGLAYSYLQVGELYADLGQYGKALEHLLPGLGISIEIGAKAFIMDTYHALYLIKRAKKEYEEAFDYLQLSNQYHDSIININVRKEIARLEIQFESERKGNHIALLEQNAEIAGLDIKRQKFINLLTLSAFIIALGFVIFLSYYLFNKNKTNKLLLERNKIIEKTRKELDSYSKQLLKAKQEAERNSRTKGEFLANMSHEIRTPLNSVIGFAELLTKSVTDPQQLNHLQTIKSSGKALLTLINDILDLSKIEAGKFIIDYGNVNLEQVFEDTVQIFSHRSFEKNITLKTNIPDELPQTIFFSELRLRQILFNLVGNAIKFTNRGGITIDALSDYAGKGDKIDLLISITDTGIGIHENELPGIFDPFNQSEINKNNQGTGLGLTITKRLVEMMHGSIDVISQEGIGTKFSICFPDVKVVDNPKVGINSTTPSVNKNKFVNILFFTKKIAGCNMPDIEGLGNFEEDATTNLEEAKSTIKNKNLVIICGFSNERSINALNVLSRAETKHKVNFIVICENEPAGQESASNATWLNSSITNKEFARVLNGVFDKIAFDEKSNFYFYDMVDKKADMEFSKGIDNIYDKYFKPALQTKMSGSMVAFLNSLEQFANKHNSYGLKSYCTELNDKITNFDIEGIDKLLGLFNTNYMLTRK